MTQATAKKLGPYLRYPGAKTKYISLLEKFYNHYRDRRIVIPFCGSLADVLGLMPKRALLNDAFPALINLHLHVQKGFFNFNWTQYKLSGYYRHRERFNEITSTPELLKKHSKEAAELLFFLNRHCFNGIVRCNSRGELNSPVGRPSKEFGTFWFPEHLLEYAPILAPWEFTCKDFSEIIPEDGDWSYLDPPYDPLKQNESFTQYGTGVSFGWERQVELAEMAANWTIPVVASNHATDRILKLYEGLGFQYITFAKSRPITCRGDRRSHTVLEMLAWKNFEPDFEISN